MNEWFPDDLQSRHLLADICATLGVDHLQGPLTETEHLREEVRRALDDGRLVAYRVHDVMSAGVSAERPEPAPPLEETQAAEREARRRVELTWIEIQLLGEDGRGIPGERYRITGPDGSVREGALDGQGLARVEGIVPGQCEVTFPALDEEAWARI
ncbi:carboxypeptidase regulatory-like domain-containing protein [Sorangium sp. So ce1099]|uniref:carboxypeptidase regulatory-like domain-containing protein n=1 Tax=Sorangium sp. So ce1099 TaxID=3133331 RepID=UPI003F644192